MQITAQLNNLRIAPRKVRLAAGLIKGKDVRAAQQQLNFLVKRSAAPLSKLLQSALQNAENNFGLLKDNLFIKEVTVNEGGKLKRFRPKAMGQAGLIQKKTSRVRIVLEEKVPGLKANKQGIKKKITETTEEKGGTKDTSMLRSEPRSLRNIGVNKKGVFDEFKNIGRKLFRRKSG